MPLTIQQIADTEALLLVWYQTIREIREEGPMQVAHQPSGEQLRYWIDTYQAVVQVWIPEKNIV